MLFRGALRKIVYVPNQKQQCSNLVNVYIDMKINHEFDFKRRGKKFLNFYALQLNFMPNTLLGSSMLVKER